MGSTGMHRESGMTDRAFFEEESPTMLREHGEIISCASMPTKGQWNRVFYAAVANNDTSPYLPGRTWALVVLMRTSRKPGEYVNFYYKDLTETMGPAEDACPDRILDLLSPTDNAYAIEWRNRCRARNVRRAKAKTLVHGQIVQFANPIAFTHGFGQAQRFRYLHKDRMTRWIALNDDNTPRFACKITGWQDLSFDIVSEPADAPSSIGT